MIHHITVTEQHFQMARAACRGTAGRARHCLVALALQDGLGEQVHVNNRDFYSPSRGVIALPAAATALIHAFDNNWKISLPVEFDVDVPEVTS